MFKNFSRILCLSMCTVFILSNTIQTKAASISSLNGVKTQIVADNKLVKIVKVTNGSETSVATLNKQTQEETITETGKDPITFSTIPKVNTKMTTSSLIAEHSDQYYGIGYDIYSNNTMDAYADEENPNWKLGMKYGAAQKTFETATDTLATNEVAVEAAFPASLVVALMAAIGVAPETLGWTAFLAFAITLGVAAANAVPLYKAYTSHSKAIEAYKLLTEYQH